MAKRRPLNRSVDVNGAYPPWAGQDDLGNGEVDVSAMSLSVVLGAWLRRYFLDWSLWQRQVMGECVEEAIVTP